MSKEFPEELNDENAPGLKHLTSQERLDWQQLIGSFYRRMNLRDQLYDPPDYSTPGEDKKS